MADLPLLAVIHGTQIKGGIRLHFLTACFTVGAVVVTVYINLSVLAKREIASSPLL
jgi:hypothetical protein